MFNNVINFINCELLDYFSDQDLDIFDFFFFSNYIILAPKVPRYTYFTMLKKLQSVKHQVFWENIFADSRDNVDIEWDEIYNPNIKCTIETHLHSFYSKLFYKAVAFKGVLHP